VKLASVAVALGLLAPAAFAQTVSTPGAIPIARIAYVDDVVEVQSPGRDWQRVPEGAALRIGDRLRTGAVGTARIDFSWMSVALAGATQIQVPPFLVLATVLEQGRIEQTSESGDMIKLVTSEAVVRGKGRVAVRREGARTLVSALEGSFRVEAAGQGVSLAAGLGTIVSAGNVPQSPVRLPPAPSRLEPGDDPLYADKDEPIMLRFASSARVHHLQLLAVDSEQVLLARDVEASPVPLKIPWLGTFRWRVSARDAAGLEGSPSRGGLIAVVAK
jgi:hypothetical protein